MLKDTPTNERPSGRISAFDNPLSFLAIATGGDPIADELPRRHTRRCTWSGHSLGAPPARWAVTGTAQSDGNLVTLVVCDRCLARLRKSGVNIVTSGDAARERSKGKFVKAVAEAIEPPDIRRRATVVREIKQTYETWPDAILGAMCWPGDEKDARDKLAAALADPPDPADADAFDSWWRRAWEGVCESIALPLYRAVLGSDARREEDRPKEGGRDTETGDPLPVADPLAELADLEAAAEAAARAAACIDDVRSVATKRDLAYLDELERLVAEGVPIEEAKIEAGKPLGLDAKGSRQLRHRLRARYEAKMAS